MDILHIAFQKSRGSWQNILASCQLMFSSAVKISELKQVNTGSVLWKLMAHVLVGTTGGHIVNTDLCI